MILGTDEDASVRTVLANRIGKNTSYELFAALAHDTCTDVRIGIAGNPATPKAIRDAMQKDSDIEVYVASLDYPGVVVDKGDGRTMRAKWIRSLPAILDSALESAVDATTTSATSSDIWQYLSFQRTPLSTRPTLAPADPVLSDEELCIKLTDFITELKADNTKVN
jgi:hypothetical protein